jgi:hypothetical protein
MDTEQEPLSIDTIVALTLAESIVLCEKDSPQSGYNYFEPWLVQLGPDGNIYIYIYITCTDWILSVKDR